MKIVVGLITPLVMVILVLAFYLAGVTGLVLAILLGIAIALKIFAYLGLYAMPGPAKSLTSWTITLAVIFILLASIQPAGEKKIPHTVVRLESNREVLTPVIIGPGTRHEFKSDGPFCVITGTGRGEPHCVSAAGVYIWRGAEPTGNLTLMAEKPATVRITAL